MLTCLYIERNIDAFKIYLVKLFVFTSFILNCKFINLLSLPKYESNINISKQSPDIDTISISISNSLSTFCFHSFHPTVCRLCKCHLKMPFDSLHTEGERAKATATAVPTKNNSNNMKEACTRSGRGEQGLRGNDAIDTSLRYRWLVPRRFPFTFP